MTEYKRKPGDIFLYGQDALDNRRDLAIYIPKIALAWTQLESLFGSSYTVLVGEEDASMFRFFHETWEFDKKLRQFTTTAKEKGLPQDAINLVTKTFNNIRREANLRNDVVHALWYAEKSQRDVLFAVYEDLHQQMFLRSILSSVATHLRTKAPIRELLPDPNGNTHMPPLLQRYDEQRFKYILQQISELSREAGNLIRVVGDHMIPKHLRLPRQSP